jgi:hypothetical protein
MNENPTISNQVKKVLEDIETQTDTYLQLTNLYTNATNHKSITDIERELLTQKVEVNMRTKFPRESSKSLGSKNDRPVEMLETIYQKIKEEFNLSQNLHKNGVKVGGSMIGGRQYIAWYVSYKNDDKWGSSIAYRQDTPDSKPVIEVSFYQGSIFTYLTGDSSAAIEKDMKTFSINDHQEYFDYFRNCVSLLV